MSSWFAGAGLRRPATRYGCSTSTTLTPASSAASFAATRSGDSDAAARAVPEHERRRGLVDQMDVRPRGAERSLQLEDEPSLAASRAAAEPDSTLAE